MDRHPQFAMNSCGCPPTWDCFLHCMDILNGTLMTKHGMQYILYRVPTCKIYNPIRVWSGIYLFGPTKSWSFLRSETIHVLAVDYSFDSSWGNGDGSCHLWP